MNNLIVYYDYYFRDWLAKVNNFKLNMCAKKGNKYKTINTQDLGVILPNLVKRFLIISIISLVMVWEND